MKAKVTQYTSTVAFGVLSTMLGLHASNLYAQKSPLLEEIIVTAQKRSENLQNVPIAITAMNQEQLTMSGIRNTDDLQLVAPGYNPYRAVANASPFLRGIGGTGTSIGNEPSVANYIDGFYISDMQSLSQHFDNIERVEVLMGPQGTLFGRNATGGVIHTITKDPSKETEGSVRVYAENYETYGGDFYGTTALGDTVSANLSVAVREQGDGYGTNVTTGKAVGFDEYVQLFSKILYQPSENTDITLLVSYRHAETDFGLLRVCGTTDDVCAGRTNEYADFGNYNDIYSDSDDSIGKNEDWLVGLRIEHSFEGFDVVSLTGWQDHSGSYSSDIDFGSEPYQVLEINPKGSEAFSQEIQILSDNESRLQWILGAFYWDDEAFMNPELRGNFTSLQSLATFVNQDTTSYALFGQIDYSLTEATTLTLGARWNYDEKDLHGESITTAASGSQTIRPYSSKDDWRETTWRAALKHSFTDSFMGYISYNRGYKSGAYNSFILNGTVPPVLDPEVLDAYAIGIKSDFADGRIQVNAEAFYYEIDGLQLRQNQPDGSTIYYNATTGELQGLEIKTLAQVTDNLSVALNYAYLDSEYQDFPGCPVTVPDPSVAGGRGGNSVIILNCRGNEMINAPEHTFGLVLNHSLPTSVGTFNSNVTYYYNDGFFYDVDARFGQPSYDLINASFTWLSDNGKYEIGIYGENIAEEEYSIAGSAASLGDTVSVGTNPRTYGLVFKVNY